MDFRRTSAPVTRAAKLDVLPVLDVKEHIRIAHDFEDRMIEGFIASAYDYLAGPDGWLGHCCLLPESYVCYASDLTADFELPMRPLMPGGIQAVEVVGDDGTYTAVDGTRYRLSEGNGYAAFDTLKPYMGDALLQVRRQGLNMADPLAYKIQFVAGYGPAQDDIPEPIRQAMKLLVGHMYQNREQTFADVRISTVNREIEFGLRALAGRYRIEPDHS